MEKQTKIARFEGGPLDGDSIEIDSQLAIYKTLKMVPVPNSSAEVTGGLEHQEFTYEEQPKGSGHFICKPQSAA